MRTTDASTQNPSLAGHLLDHYANRIARAKRPYVLALSGLQGSGKSTLAQHMKTLAQTRGWSCEVLALDDFYYPRSEREALAQHVHPLLRTRGVPGTHEAELLLSILNALPSASEKRPLTYPRFDKSRDTRAVPSRWHKIARPPQLVIVEGWALGLTPQRIAALEEPVNTLEREEDPHGEWRRWVNKQLRSYQPLWRRFDALIVLQAPDWPTVYHWRAAQEAHPRQSQLPLAMSEAALQRLLAHTERLSRHALATLPEQADSVVEFNAARRVVAVHHWHQASRSTRTATP